MALTAQGWELEYSLAENALAIEQPKPHLTRYMENSYPDWFLTVKENFRISEVFYGYSDSLSIDNKPMILVELKALAHRYGTPIYVVDQGEWKDVLYFQRGL